MSGTGFRVVLRVREFRWLLLADLRSLLGDALARVALSVLVHQQNRSGLRRPQDQSAERPGVALMALAEVPQLCSSITGEFR